MRGRSMAVIGGLASLAAVGWARPWRYRACPSALLDEVLPTYEFRDTISLEIPADTKRIMRSARELRLRDMEQPYGEALWPFGWIVHQHRAKSGYLPRAALFRLCDKSDQSLYFLRMVDRAQGVKRLVRK